MVVFKGLLIGLLLALPVGPAGAISTRRALTQGYRACFLSGLGASVSDVIYLMILEFAFPSLRPSFTLHWMRAIAGIFITYIGVTLLLPFDPTSEIPKAQENQNDFAIFASTFLVSVANPATLVSLSVMLEAFDVRDPSIPVHSVALLIVSVFCGATTLWLGLARGLSNPRFLFLARRASAILFLSLGLGIVWVALVK